MVQLAVAGPRSLANRGRARVIIAANHNHSTMPRLACALVVALLAERAAFAAEEPSLELKPTGVVLPGEAAYMGVWARGVVSEMDVRVYRVPDSLTFLAGNPMESQNRRRGEPAPPPLSAGLAAEALLRRFTHRVQYEKDNAYALDTIKVLEAGTPAGAYLVEARAGEVESSTVVLVSAIRFTARVDRTRTLVFATDGQTGRPLPDAEVFVSPSGGEGTGVPRGMARTGADGIALLPPLPAARSYVLLVRSGGDVVAGGMRGQGDGGSPEPLSPKIDIETDRPIYRPGHEVRFKVLLRNRVADDRYEVPGAAVVSVVVQSPDRQHAYFRTELTANDFGSAHGSFQLPKEAGVGSHRLVVTWGKEWAVQWIRVDDYRKPVFKVDVRADRTECTPGDPLNVDIAASYYFGEPVAGGVVAYELYWVDERVGGGEGTLDAAGHLLLSFPAPGRPRPGLLRIVAQVTDAASQRIAGAGSVRLVPGEGSFTIGLEAEALSVGEPLLFSIRTSVDDVPVSRPLKLRLTRPYWDEKSRRQQVDTLEEKATASDAAGRAALRFVPEVAGSYCLDVAGQDARGRAFEERHCAWVGRSRPWYLTGGSLTLEPDRRTSAPGDTVQVRLRSPVDEATVLLTVEGPTLIEHRLVTVTGGRASIPIGITSAFRPNVRVHATLVSRGRFFEGSTDLRVPPMERFLTVEVQSDRPVYQPGETAEVEVRVRDKDGRPADAELSIKGVDEAIYALRGDHAARIDEVFYGWRPLGVWTYNSSWDVQVSAARAAAAGPEGAPPDVPDARVRRRFEDTLFWQATARSGPEGVVRLRVPLADNLTTWRVMARGADRDTRVGQVTGTFRARRPLMVRLGLPRFIRERDRGQALATVHNGSDAPIDARVRLTAEGVEVEGAPEQSARVEPGGAATLAWSYVASAPGTARFSAFAASSSKETDAEELEVPIHRHGLEVKRTASRVLEKDLAVAVFPPEAADEVSVELAHSLAGPALAGVEYLLRYPYGCVEQTMSAYLPAVVVSRALRHLGKGVDEPEPRRRDLPAIVRDGTLRLYRFQHRDGGWGWWENDASDPFMTAYVLYGLAQTRQAGYDVESQVMEKGVEAARAMLAASGPRPPDLRTRAYLLYALAEAASPDADAVRALLSGSESAKLSAADLSLLTLALARMGDPAAARRALGRLMSLAERREGLVWWPAPPRPTWRDSSVLATALALRALLAVEPDRRETDAAVRWLMARRRGPGEWLSTLHTAHVLYALSEHIRLRGEAAAAPSYEVVADGKVLFSGTFNAADVLREPRRLEVPSEARGKRFEVRKTGTGALYATLTRRRVPRAEPVLPIARGGLRLERAYVRLVPVRGSDGTLTYRREPLGTTGTLERGDLVLVRLAARLASDAEYVMVEDRLPSGFEVVGRPRGLDEEPPGADAAWPGHSEVRDDRIAFFAASLEAGRRPWSYVLRAEKSGAYHAMPAQAELMYFPDTRANTAETRIVVH